MPARPKGKVAFGTATPFENREKKQVVLFGIGSPIVVEYLETCDRLGWSIVAAVKNLDGRVYFDDYTKVMGVDAVGSMLSHYPCFCPMFTPANRAIATREAGTLGFRFGKAMIDPLAITAQTSRIGGGSFVNAGCILAAELSISRHVLVNRGASIGHHTAIHEFASIGPGAILGAFVLVGSGAVVGAGAIVLPKVQIGDFALVCAGAVVTHDVPPRAKVVGNPARVIATDLADFGIPNVES
jgi:sugar O-acyltransferase (sialic acid O-acetyltransferase NeuD family)